MHDDRIARNAGYVAGKASEIVGPDGSVTTETNEHNVTFSVTFSPADAKRLRVRGSMTTIVRRSTMLDDTALDYVIRLVTTPQ